MVYSDVFELLKLIKLFMALLFYFIFIFNFFLFFRYILQKLNLAPGPYILVLAEYVLEQIYGEKQPTSEESSPNISEDGSSDQNRDESNIFEKVTAKKPRNVIDLSEELSIFSAVSNVDLENLNLSIITNIKDLLNTAFLASHAVPKTKF